MTIKSYATFIEQQIFLHQYVPERKSCERALDPYRISFVLLFHRIAMNFFIIMMIGEEFLWTGYKCNAYNLHTRHI